MKKIIVLLFLSASCRSLEDVQVTGYYSVLVKKTISFRGNGERVVQYWQKSDEQRGVVFWEMLPAGDTGSAVGTILKTLTQR